MNDDDIPDSLPLRSTLREFVTQRSRYARTAPGLWGETTGGGRDAVIRVGYKAPDLEYFLKTSRQRPNLTSEDLVTNRVLVVNVASCSFSSEIIGAEIEESQDQDMCRDGARKRKKNAAPESKRRAWARKFGEREPDRPESKSIFCRVSLIALDGYGSDHQNEANEESEDTSSITHISRNHGISRIHKAGSKFVRLGTQSSGAVLSKVDNRMIHTLAHGTVRYRQIAQFRAPLAFFMTRECMDKINSVFNTGGPTREMLERTLEEEAKDREAFVAREEMFGQRWAAEGGTGARGGRAPSITRNLSNLKRRDALRQRDGFGGATPFGSRFRDIFYSHLHAEYMPLAVEISVYVKSTATRETKRAHIESHGAAYAAYAAGETRLIGKARSSVFQIAEIASLVARQAAGVDLSTPRGCAHSTSWAGGAKGVRGKREALMVYRDDKKVGLLVLHIDVLEKQMPRLFENPDYVIETAFSNGDAAANEARTHQNRLNEALEKNRAWCRKQRALNPELTFSLQGRENHKLENFGVKIDRSRVYGEEDRGSRADTRNLSNYSDQGPRNLRSRAGDNDASSLPLPMSIASPLSYRPRSSRPLSPGVLPSRSNRSQRPPSASDQLPTSISCPPARAVCKEQTRDGLPVLPMSRWARIVASFKSL